jgi:hypothetical protein
MWMNVDKVDGPGTSCGQRREPRTQWMPCQSTTGREGVDILNGSSLFLLGDGQNLQISRIVTGKRASEKLPGHGAVRVKSRSPNDCFVIALHSPDGADETGLCVCPPEKTPQTWFPEFRGTLSPVRFRRENRRITAFSSDFQRNAACILCTLD